MIHKALDYVQQERFKTFFNMTKAPELTPLAQGEYNVNFTFKHEEKKYVLRLNTGSQLHLEKQMTYEYRALEELYPSRRTPKPIYLDDTKEILHEGVLVMEFLPGRSLDYRRDLEHGAAILSDIHALKVPENTSLLKADAPLKEIFDECLVMAEKYLTWEKGEIKSQRLLEKMIETIYKLPLKEKTRERHYINTELNSGNFLIGNRVDKSYLIDWEKPIISEVSQDLGHFLVPTTTYWKTDVILTPEEVADFVSMYKKKVEGRFSVDSLDERLPLFLKTTCLRGISWSAMALREYDSPRALVNEDTHQKIKEYLTEDFLSMIYKDYMEGQ